MFQHVASAYHRFANWTGRSGGSRPLVSLEVVALEERATPAASYVPLLVPPQTVLVAPIAAPAPGNGGLAIPMAGQSMVRLDLIAAGDSSQTEQPEESVFAAPHRQEADAPPAAQPNAEDLAVSDEELAELLAAQPDA
jgi:hypothetical protein